MHPFFAPLNVWEESLLLTTLTVGGGSDHVGIFAHLPAESSKRLQEKAQALLAIAADKRLALMVRELREILATNGRRGIERVDPSWIIHHMKGESPRVVATILLGLPAPLVRSLLKRLPTALRRALPPKSEIHALPEAITEGVRQRFEARFHPMPTPTGGPMVFRDVVHLERAELFHLTRDLGLIELGQAFVSVGKMALAELCRRLPRERAEELVQAVKVASHVDLPDVKSAQRFLSRVVMNFEDTEEFLQKSGLWRMAKACRLETNEANMALAQRLPRKAGQLLFLYIAKAAEMEDLTPEVLKRLQDSILTRVKLLAQMGRLGSALHDVQFQFHDPVAAQAALDAAAKPSETASPAETDAILSMAIGSRGEPKPPK